MVEVDGGDGQNKPKKHSYQHLMNLTKIKKTVELPGEFQGTNGPWRRGLLVELGPNIGNLSNKVGHL